MKKLKPNKPCVYRIYHKVIRREYIGGCKDFTKRCREHKSSLRRGNNVNRSWQQDWNATKPEEWVFEIIEYCSFKKLRDREAYWIVKSKDPYNRHRRIDRQEAQRLYATGQYSQREIGRLFGIAKCALHIPKSGLSKTELVKKQWKNDRDGTLVRAKLTATQILEIRRKYIPKIYTQKRLAREYGVTQAQIHHITSGKQWQEGPDGMLAKSARLVAKRRIV